MINSINWCVFGDSIGIGVAQAAFLPYNCKIGRQPSEIWDSIKNTSREFIKGRAIILSTGLSNNPDGRFYVQEQIKDLLSKDARLIMVLGVGPGNDKVNFRDTNEWLSLLTETKVFFFGPLVPHVTVWSTGNQPGIHPVDYQEIIDRINNDFNL